MPSIDLTFATLRNQVMRRVFQHVFTGPLLLVWSVGLVVFVTFFERSGVAFIWSAAIAVLGYSMAMDYLRTAKIQKWVIQSILWQRVAGAGLSNLDLKIALQDQVNIGAEIVVKICLMDRKHGRDAQLRRLIPVTFNLLSLLRDCAVEAGELERGLKLATRTESQGDLLSQGVASMRRKVDQANLRVDRITQGLEMLMLKIFQLEQLPKDPFGNSELARETDEMCARLMQTGDLYLDRDVAERISTRSAMLEVGFSEIGCADGVGALQRLAHEYEQLQPLLERQREIDSIAIAQIPLLVEETFDAGLNLLRDALSIARAIQPAERQRLNAEVVTLDEQIAVFQTTGNQEERLKHLQETRFSHLERLALMEKQQSRVEDLLHLSGRCEAALHRTRMELAALKAADSGMSVERATEGLRKTIDQAKEVQQELDKLGL
jgi:hypothetical protein